ncbi:hypothetical protein B0J12DRAFT_661973 [Macrophomina phaseolina]|uniref:Nephrocystin 3-like N-terminal domain-containing protein n=1 Tax=Macrophomina phaseolina TaxID=35725 RepID=A0ABQ8GBI9_9PEZI|nr:hypothetical protein B0J12DRAFT_661973 [Macrophomina phaseolina]
MHPALSVSHELPFDFCPGTFDWIFDLEEFEHWIDKVHSWQLRCVGPPGSGKTTLSALALARLRERFRGQKEAVAAIFLLDDVNYSHEGRFCEDLLDSVYCQLSSRQPHPEDLATSFYATYRDAREHGKQNVLHLLRKALAARLAILERAFLVLDDIDRCYESSALEAELSRLQELGLKILVTSRVPLNTSVLEYRCDTGVHGKEEWEVPCCKVCWWCSKCKYDIICHGCKEAGHVCKSCGKEGLLVEPYEKIDLMISIPDPVLYSFVSFSLESVHGDLNLQIPGQNLPPISPLGSLIRKHAGGTYAEILVNMMVDRAEGNIGFARLLLELVHESCSIEEVEDSIRGAGDRIPKRILDYFDAGIGKIQERPVKAERDLGLKAISVAATCEECCYKTFDEVKQELGEGTRKAGTDHLAPIRVVDDVIRAANGLLVQMEGEDRRVAPYNTYFGIYVRQNYNTALFWEHTLMKAHHERSNSRTHEFAGLGKTNTLGAGKLLKMRKHIKAVSKLLKKKKDKANLKEYTGFKLSRRITGAFG